MSEPIPADVEPKSETGANNIQLPDDHPLVKTLAEQKRVIDELRQETGASGSLSKKLAELEALREKAKKYDEYEESQKSELEKLQARADEAERRAQSLEIESIRNSIALSKGLTPTQAKRLVGSTLEELEADADELLADLKASRPAAAASSDGQGRTGEPVGSVKQITSREQLKGMSNEEIRELRRTGALNQLMGISD